MCLKKILILIFALFFITACGKEDGDNENYYGEENSYSDNSEEIPDSAGEEGIYKINYATQNNDSCDYEGKSYLGTIYSKYFSVMILGSSEELKTIFIFSCKNITDCKENVNRIRKEKALYCVGEFCDLFIDSPDDNYYESHSYSRREQNGICKDPTLTDSYLLILDDSKTAEWSIKLTFGEDFEQENGECSLEKLKELDNLPCDQYTVIKGTFIQKLP